MTPSTRNIYRPSRSTEGFDRQVGMSGRAIFQPCLIIRGPAQELTATTASVSSGIVSKGPGKVEMQTKRLKQKM